MLGLREDASLLIAEGYGYGVANALPLAVLWTEARIVRDRVNSRMATEATLLKAAVVDVIAGSRHLNEALELLRNG